MPHFKLMTSVIVGMIISNSVSAEVLLGPITYPANGHQYYQLNLSTWTAGEAEAVDLGGHLVTINDALENEWIRNTFAGRKWIGFTDDGQEDDWYWISGEPVTFLNWKPGEPNNIGSFENYAEMGGTSGQWNDVPDGGWGELKHGIVEVVPEPSTLALMGLGILMVVRRNPFKL